LCADKAMEAEKLATGTTPIGTILFILLLVFLII
jgi:hypothetical protein